MSKELYKRLFFFKTKGTSVVARIDRNIVNERYTGRIVTRGTKDTSVSRINRELRARVSCQPGDFSLLISPGRKVLPSPRASTPKEIYEAAKGRANGYTKRREKITEGARVRIRTRARARQGEISGGGEREEGEEERKIAKPQPPSLRIAMGVRRGDPRETPCKISHKDRRPCRYNNGPRVRAACVLSVARIPRDLADDRYDEAYSLAPRSSLALLQLALYRAV